MLRRALVEGHTLLAVPDGAGWTVASRPAGLAARLVPPGFLAGLSAGRGAAHVLLSVSAADA